MGKSIRRIRQYRGLTQAELAVRLKVDAATVEVWESGRMRVAPYSVLAIAKCLDCNLQELFSDMSEAVHSENIVL